MNKKINISSERNWILARFGCTNHRALVCACGLYPTRNGCRDESIEIQTSTLGASKGTSAKHIKSSQLVNSPLGFTLTFTMTLIVTILAKRLRMYIGFSVVRSSDTIQWVFTFTMNRVAPIC